MKTVIQVENLWKKYRLGTIGTGTLRHDLNRWWHRVCGNPDPYSRVGDGSWKMVDGVSSNRPSSNGQGSPSPTSDLRPPTSDLADDEMWALRDVSFEVKQGEILGIIGRNGAGKSTLLKILSRVTAPTRGQVKVKGRIASLLEVGTGFHPELTGRENIFLNGAILGMTKAEIRGKLDEIVAFAEIEKFIDTPVKRYSSGMYVRLAFAVAAHLEPEILIVDEVLAVGDTEFQKKCLGKMKDVAGEGRTVLFVSHNLSAVVNLCSTGLLVSHGSLIMQASADQVCHWYINDSVTNGSERKSGAIVKSVDLIDGDGVAVNSVPEGDPLRFICAVRLPKDNCKMSLIVRDSRANPVFELVDTLFSPPRIDGATRVLVESQFVPLRPGRYSVDTWVGDGLAHRLELLEYALGFNVVPSRKSEIALSLAGSFSFPSTWSVANVREKMARRPFGLPPLTQIKLAFFVF